MSLVLRISFIFSLIIHLIFRSVNLVTELLLCVNNFGIGERLLRLYTYLILELAIFIILLCPLSLAWAQTITSNPSVVSTRGHFGLDTGELLPGYNTTDFMAVNIPGFQVGACPPEIAIYVHGVWANEREFLEQMDRLTMSLHSDRYVVPVVGFSWDSNTGFSPHGWQIAKNIANQNGPKLAHFISDLKNTCQRTNIRIIAHSLGANVTNSTLVNLDNTKTWKNNAFKITSVDLLGAAVNSDTPSINRFFGKAIEHVVDKFYNVYDPMDDMLFIDCTANEQHAVLGLVGAGSQVTRPANYIQQDVAYDLQHRDANGTAQIDCLDYLVPLYDNHCGYIGFRDPLNHNSIISDGVISVVVADWKETKP
jgi:hypothetical protein